MAFGQIRMLSSMSRAVMRRTSFIKSCLHSTVADFEHIPKPQQTPSSWRGEDMATPRARSSWTYHLNQDDLATIERQAEKSMPLFVGTTANRHVRLLEPKDFPLSPSLQDKLTTIKSDLIHGRGFALLRGLPVHNYNEKELATIFIGLGAHIGNARSQNKSGHLLGHVLDLGLDSDDPNVRIYQTNERQTFHTDSCDVVGLLCLRMAKRGGLSLLVSANSVYNELYQRRPDLLRLLLQPIATDRRGEVPPDSDPFLLIPVFSSWHGHMTVFYQRQYIDSAQRFSSAPRLTCQHVEALDLFDAVCNDPAMHLKTKLEPGDIQFVHNHSMLHDRTGFEDWVDIDRRRHLLRLWLSVPGDRPLPPIFASRFGSVEVGNRGGIVLSDTKFCVPFRDDILKTHIPTQ